MQRALLPLLALPILLAGCGTMRADAPSLLPRPIETRGSAESVEAIPVPPDPAFDARVAAAVAAFDAAARDFDTALKAIEPRVRRAASAPAQSDAWIDAQAALGEIGGARGTTDAALADLESLAIARGADGQPPNPTLDAAIARANATVDAQNSAVERLQAIPKPL